MRESNQTTHLITLFYYLITIYRRDRICLRTFSCLEACSFWHNFIESNFLSNSSIDWALFMWFGLRFGMRWENRHSLVQPFGRFSHLQIILALLLSLLLGAMNCVLNSVIVLTQSPLLFIGFYDLVLIKIKLKISFFDNMTNYWLSQSIRSCIQTNRITESTILWTNASFLDSILTNLSPSVHYLSKTNTFVINKVFH